MSKWDDVCRFYTHSGKKYYKTRSRFPDEMLLDCEKCKHNIDDHLWDINDPEYGNCFINKCECKMFSEDEFGSVIEEMRKR